MASRSSRPHHRQNEVIVEGAGSGDRRYYAYCLVGFESFLDSRTVEFLERLPDVQVCDGCGAVPSKPAVLPCMHTSCLRCSASSYLHKCPVDGREFRSGQFQVLDTGKNELMAKMVRCLCASEGCGYTGPLSVLGNHFPRGCDFARTICSRCGARFLFKELSKHYTTCNTRASSASLKSAKFKRLYEDLANAKKELEEAVSRISNDEGLPRMSVSSMLEAVERLKAELGDDVA
ncbi:hypothetical protein HPB48_026435 [Haemaphysalis longicornis]|uniref:Uncharacterized protein n=1 Tax=Haemaphysalis longicornis TaxID=44386 RepID=A0A9J6HAR7_HAELO|nr:hypothetical protein HPB48_026435 [Haemaphysalis longicornis]